MGDPEWVSVSMHYISPGSSPAEDQWAVEARQRGGTGDQRLLDVSERVPDPAIAAALGVEAGKPVVVRRRLILFDDQPVELIDSFYPTSLARGTALAEPRKIRGGAIGLLRQMGYRPAQAIEDVWTRPATGPERENLGLRDGEWVLGLTRLLQTGSGQPIEVSAMAMVPHGRRLRYQLSIDQ